MKKVLITGASGFVGFHLIEAALQAGLEVVAAVRATSNVSHLQYLRVRYVYPRFTDVEDVGRLLQAEQFDYIIHAAGTTKANNQQQYNAVNAGYTHTLAQAVTRYLPGLEQMVFISSLAALGPSNKAGELITESKLPQPVTAYGKSKLLAEQQITAYSLPLVTLRPTAVYGPREKDIFIILQTIARGLEPYIGRINQQLSFIYVKDLAALTIRCLSAGQRGTYNVTDGGCYNRYQMADITKDVLGQKTFKFHVPQGIVKVLAGLLETTYGWAGKTPALNIEKLNELAAINWCCDTSLLQTELGFTPSYRLETGLRETLLWYKQQGWL